MGERNDDIMLDDVEYKNGSKNHWRRTMWNRLREQIPDPRDAIILYLPGSKDLDRDEALRRGFKPWNLIAVEREKKVAKVLRKKGTITINCDLLKVMHCWPKHTKPAAVIADLQCGLTYDSAAIISAMWMRDCLSDVVLTVNLQRGRETGLFAQHAKNYSTVIPYFMEEMHRRDMSAKHRGFALIDMAILGLTCAITNRNLNDFSGHTQDPEWMARFKRNEAYLRGMIGVAQLPSYRSTERSPMFDSVLFRRKAFEKNAEWPVMKGIGDDDHVKACISAALAIRTMRMN